MLNWGYVIKKLRLEMGLTQEELASKAGVGRSWLERVEHGDFESVKDQKLQKLAFGLGMDIAELRRRIYNIPTDEPPKKLSPDEILEQLKLATPLEIPVYEDFPIKAGGANETLDYVYIERRKAAGRKIEAYRIKGNCLSPKIESGDVVMVDRAGEINVGNIAMCVIDDEVHIGYIRRIGDELYLENGHGSRKLEDCQAAALVLGKYSDFI